MGLNGRDRQTGVQSLLEQVEVGAMADADRREEKYTPEEQQYAELFGDRFLRLLGRTQNNKMAARLSKLLGREVNPARISEWKHGKFVPSTLVWFAMLEASDESLDDVMFEGRMGQALLAMRARLEERDQERDITLRECRDQLQQVREMMEENRRLLEAATRDRQDWGLSVRGHGEVHLGPPGPENEPEPPAR